MPKYLHLPGTAGHRASTPDAAAFDFTTDVDLTIEVWLSVPDTTPAARAILLGHSDTAFITGWSFYLEPAGSLIYRFHDGANNSITFAAPGLTPNQIHHLAVVHDFSGDNVTLYVDGVAHGTVGHPGATTGYTANADPMRVGAGGSGDSSAAGRFYSAVIAQGMASGAAIAAATISAPAAGTTVVGFFEANLYASGATNAATAVDTTGKTWTINGAGSFIIGPPPNVAAVANSVSQITVSWDNIANETGYIVERSPDGVGTWTNVSGTLAADTVSFANTGLDCATQYFYRVSAVFAAATSDPSSVVNATTTGLVAPANPGATTISSSQIDVDWDDVTGETGYRVERSLTGAGGWSNVSGTLAAGTTTYSSFGLTASTQYFYRVIAQGTGCESAPSTTVDATTNAAPPSPVAAQKVIRSPRYGLTRKA